MVFAGHWRETTVSDREIRSGYRAMVHAGPEGLRACLEPEQVRVLIDLGTQALRCPMTIDDLPLVHATGSIVPWRTHGLTACGIAGTSYDVSYVDDPPAGRRWCKNCVKRIRTYAATKHGDAAAVREYGRIRQLLESRL